MFLLLLLVLLIALPAWAAEPFVKFIDSFNSPWVGMYPDPEPSRARQAQTYRIQFCRPQVLPYGERITGQN